MNQRTAPSNVAPPVLWVTWEHQVRNRTLSEHFGAELREIALDGQQGIRRYFGCIARTVPLLWRWRGKKVVVQNPSLVLALIATILKFPLRYTLIVDAHNAGIHPAEGRVRGLRAVANWVIKAADYTIVSNSGLAGEVVLKGGRALVIPDPLPQHLCERQEAARHAQGNEVAATAFIVFVCSWAEDEPYREVIKAAEFMPNVRFAVTGNSKGKDGAIGFKMPPNVTLTGYLPDLSYELLLMEADIIIDLTTREDCLVCGAYEAVALEKPFVLSNTRALRDYFRKGGVYVDNDAESIASGARIVLDDLSRYRTDVSHLKSALLVEWGTNFSTIKQKIGLN